MGNIVYWGNQKGGKFSHRGDRVRTKAGKDGFARTVAASVVATNLCQIEKFLMKRDQKRLRRAA